MYTLIVSHKSCSMLCILIQLILQKNCKNVWQIMCFWTQSKNTQPNKISNIKSLAAAANRTRELWQLKRICTSAPGSQLVRWSKVVKLFNHFNAMGRNASKQSRICVPHILNKFMFSVIFFTCVNNYIWQFVICTRLGFTT